MAAARIPRTHFACVIGGSDVSLLPHLVAHYRDLGVESFYLIRHAETVADPGYTRIAEEAARAGIKLFHTHVGPWSLELNQRLIRYAMDENPDDWYVIADSDEFHVYDRPLADLTAHCDSAGYEHVTGCFLDRVGTGGDFPEVGPQSLWRQFPLAGSISAGLLRALPLKIGLCRGTVELYSGQHGTADGRGLPFTEGFIQVHHFKWTASVVARLEERVARLSAGARPQDHGAIVRENRRFLAHIHQHDGRINVVDPRFMLHHSGAGYSNYPYWREVMDEALGWRWSQI